MKIITLDHEVLSDTRKNGLWLYGMPSGYIEYVHFFIFKSFNTRHDKYYGCYQELRNSEYIELSKGGNLTFLRLFIQKITNMEIPIKPWKL